MKKCTKCKKEKPVSMYYRCNRNKNGLMAPCKECTNNIRKQYQKRYYERNKKRIIQDRNNYKATRDGGLYKKYWNIVARCNYKSHSRYRFYGAKGTKVLWKNYAEFRNDMLTSFKRHAAKHGLKDTTIDRIIPWGDYCKENCRWLRSSDQHRNTRKTASNRKKYQNSV